MKYEVQRKLPTETNYTTIYRTTPAAGQVLRNSTYRYTDQVTTNPAGVIQYRVVQWIDTTVATAEAILLDSLQVLLNDLCNTSLQPAVQLFPNPAVSSTRLVVNYAATASTLQIAVTDKLGRTFNRYSVPLRSPLTSTTLSIASYPKGTYLITVWDGKQKIGTAQLVKD
jgi:hypothetical protein